jgi:elongation factor Ts
MAEITAKMVAELRKRTGCGMMDCKKALVENDGDVENAIDWLRQKGLARAAKRADREATEGVLALHLSADHGAASVVQLASETDFVARNDEFIAYANAAAELVTGNADLADVEKLRAADHPAGGTFGSVLDDLTNKLGENLSIATVSRFASDNGWVGGYVHGNGKLAAVVTLAWDGDGKPDAPPEGLAKDIGMQIVARAPLALRREDVPADEVEREKGVYLASEALQKKPENIRGKIVEGQINKWFAEQVLLEQPFVKDDKQSVATHVSQAGEGKITIAAYERFAIGN